jgi:hypothetical protein
MSAENNPGFPGPIPEQQGLQRLPDARDEAGLVPMSDHSSLAIPRSASEIVRSSGFDVARLTQRLGALNETLVAVAPPKSRGFNLELVPGGSAHLDVSAVSSSPFKVELMGDAEGNAEVRILRRERSRRREWMRLADVQEFVANAFSGKEATFVINPIKDLMQGPIYLRRLDLAPRNLYEEAKDPSWRGQVRQARLEQINTFLEGLLPTIEMDFSKVTEDQLRRLTDRIEGAQIDVTFYNKWDENRRKRKIARRETMTGLTPPQLYSEFDIMLDGQQDPALQFDTHHDNWDGLHLIFYQLNFKGKAGEVETALAEFNKLLQTTQGYKDAVADQQPALEEGKE